MSRKVLHLTRDKPNGTDTSHSGARTRKGGCPHPRELAQETLRWAPRPMSPGRPIRRERRWRLAAIQLRRERRRPRAVVSPADHTAALDRSTELGLNYASFRAGEAPPNTRGRGAPQFSPHIATGRDRNDVTRHRSRVDDLCSPAGCTDSTSANLNQMAASGERDAA